MSFDRSAAPRQPTTPRKKTPAVYPVDDLQPVIANVAAENAILGAMIEDASIFCAVLDDGLTEGHFSTDHNARSFRALLGMQAKGIPISLISIMEYMNWSTHVADYITGCVVEESHILHYCQIVKNKSRLRELLHLAEEIETMSREPGAQADTVEALIRSRIGGE